MESFDKEIQEMIKELRGFFSYLESGDLNYWGVLNGNTFCSYGCLKCGKVTMEIKEFVRCGPSFSDPYFCREHGQIYYSKLLHLSKYLNGPEEKKKVADLLGKSVFDFIELLKTDKLVLENLKKNLTWFLI